MALQTRITYANASAACDAVVDSVDGGSGAGTVTLYGGTQPANADTATGETALAIFTLSDPAFGAASNGVATAASMPKTTTGAAAGTATWFRVKTSAGTTCWDGSVGTSGCDMTIDNTSIAVGQTVNLTSWTVTMPRQ